MLTIDSTEAKRSILKLMAANKLKAKIKQLNHEGGDKYFRLCAKSENTLYLFNPEKLRQEQIKLLISLIRPQ